MPFLAGFFLGVSQNQESHDWGRLSAGERAGAPPILQAAKRLAPSLCNVGGDDKTDGSEARCKE